MKVLEKVVRRVEEFLAICEKNKDNKITKNCPSLYINLCIAVSVYSELEWMILN